MSGLYLIAEIAGRAVAIPSDGVDSVVDIADVTAIPRSPAAIVGLAALRSRVVTVIDPRASLGGAGAPGLGRAVIVRADGHHYAVLVDSLEDAVALPLQPLEGGLPLDPAWAAAARGIVERDGEPILVVDLTALMPLHGVAA